jgi:AcrR family transcriptional regulator
MTKPGRPSSRQAILDAAVNLLAEVGAGHLTLEGVAQRAGVSKGGLLYNFPTKNALLAAMIDGHMAWAKLLLAEMEDTPDAAIREIVQRQFDARFSWLCNAATDRTAHSMLAAVAEQPELLEPIRKLQRAFWEKIKAGATDPNRLWLAWLASEGLLFDELMSLSPLSLDERGALLARLRAEVAEQERV